MQVAVDGGEVGGTTTLLVRTLILEPRTPDLPVPNYERVDHRTRLVRSVSRRVESAGQKKGLQIFAGTLVGWGIRELRNRGTATPGPTSSSFTNGRCYQQERELAIRRVKWWLAMPADNHTHLQTMAAVWWQLSVEAQTLTAEGTFSTHGESIRSGLL